MTNTIESGPRAWDRDDRDITPAERGRSLSAAVRRRWPILIAVTGLTVAAALALSLHSPKTYDATAKILLQPTDAVRLAVAPNSLPSPANAQRDVETNAQLITAPRVVAAVRRELHLRMPASALTAEVTVSGQERTNIVSITVSDRSPRRAAVIAGAFADAYRAYRRETARNAISDAIRAGTVQLGRDVPARDRVQRLALRERIGQLKASYAVETGGVEIVNRAEVPSAAATPRPVVSALVAVIAGILLGIGAAFGADRLDRRLRDPSDIEAAVGAPVLALIRSDDDERWEALATRLLLGRRRGRALMLTRCALEGSSAAATANLASSMAELGRRVIVVEADRVRPASSPTRTGGAPGGLEAVLDGRSELGRAVVKVEVAPGADYAVLRAEGGGLPAPSLFSHPGLAALLSEAGTHADIVLVQGGPLLGAGAWAPATASGEVLLLGTKPTSAEAQEARRALEEFRVRVAGIVIVPRSYEDAAAAQAPADARAHRSGEAAAAHRGVAPGVVQVSQATSQGG